MGAQTLAKRYERVPLLFEDFFKPWNGWFGDEGSLLNRVLSVPAANITENKDYYEVALAVPGMKKDDLKIDVQGNLLTISSEKEETKEENDKQFTRKEYNYSSFTRSFSLPDEVNQEKIGAKYEDGILKLTLPRREESKKFSAKQITVK
jgi:HSP20 family protein